ncbi:MAG: AraC family transcriptional regulator [Eubacteriales bacterium]
MGVRDRVPPELRRRQAARREREDDRHSHACGYRSVWHFEREFRKKFGVTPTEYRLGNRQSDTGGENK